MRRRSLFCLFVLISFLFMLTNPVLGEDLVLDWTSTYNSPNNSDDESQAIAVDKFGNVYIAGFEYRGDLVEGYNILVIKYNSAGFEVWTSTYNSPNNNTDYGNGIAVDSVGNVYVAGHENRGDLGEGYNIWVRKYDTNGNTLWTETYNSPHNSSDKGNGIAVDNVGNVYVTGYEDRSDLAQTYNIWVRKYDTNGNTLWTKTYNSPNDSNDKGNGIAVDSVGNVYVTGSEYRSDLGQNNNIWVRKYDTNGNTLWTSTYNSPADNNDRGFDIAVDSSGNVYVAGHEYRPDLLENYNIWVRKYDTNGNTLWTSTYNSPADNTDQSYGIAVDGSGNVYVTGYEERSDLGQDVNIWVGKFDSNGDLLWTETYNSPADSEDYGSGIVVDNYGNLYVTGYEYRSDLGESFNTWTRKYRKLGKDFADDLENVIIYPNPYKSNMVTNVITFADLTENAKIQIYTISGNLIYEVKVDSVDYQWDIKNKDGKDIASGVYIYFITDANGGEKSGKFAIIK